MRRLCILLLAAFVASGAFGVIPKEHYFSVARGSDGAVIDGAQVAVFLAGTSTPAVIYSDAAGTLKGNPFTTDAQGNYAFFATPARYKIVVTKIGVGSFTVDNVPVGVQDHAESHALGSTDPLDASNLTGVLPDPQRVEVAADGSSLGEGTLLDIIASDTISAADGGEGAAVSLDVIDGSLTADHLAEGSVGASEVASNAISNDEVDVNAAIAESKLALNFPTHSTANDPSTGQKAALAGTFGTPGIGNKYVTTADPRLGGISGVGPIASMPTCEAGTDGWIWSATDAVDSADCSRGLSTETTVCQCDGTSWSAVGNAPGTYIPADDAQAIDAANGVWGIRNGIRFEGVTADAYEIILAPADATGTSKTVTLPNESGTVLLDTAGTAVAASALAANGANCSAGSYPLGVDASGAVEDCTTAVPVDNPTFTTAIATPTITLGTVSQPILVPDAAYTLGLRNGTNPQTFRLYGTYANTGADVAYLQFSATDGAMTIVPVTAGTANDNQTVTLKGEGPVGGLTLDGSDDVTGAVTISAAGVVTASSGFSLSAGSYYLGSGTQVEFEGSSQDGYETLFYAVNPTADQTITLPNATGTVALIEGVNSYTGASTFTATPTGATVGTGSVYINPASMAAGEAAAWTYEAGWSFTGMSGGGVKISFGDLDGDGDKDLMTGGDLGLVYAYKNTGTALVPAWTREAGWDIADIGERSVPTLGDLDGDGDLDMMMGEKDEIYGYKNTGTTAAPTWATEATWNIVTTNGHNPMPTLVDMDADGDLDVVFTTLYAYGLNWYKNTGSASAPTWSLDTAWNYANAHKKVSFADLDGDGDLDMMYGRDHKVFAIKNNGTVSAPTWAAYSGWDLNVNREFPTLADLDGDGDADMIAGADGGSQTVSGYRNTGSLGAVGNTLFGVAVGGASKMKVGGLTTDITGQLNVTGALYTTTNVILEGSSPDSYELTLAATNPTADRTATFQDRSGIVDYSTRVVEAVTAACASPNVLLASESGKTITNYGVTAEGCNTLPAAEAGLWFKACVMDVDGLRLTAGTGDTIRLAGVVSASAGYVRSTVIGSCLTLEALDSDTWYATSIVDAWTLE